MNFLLLRDFSEFFNKFISNLNSLKYFFLSCTDVARVEKSAPRGDI